MPKEMYKPPQESAREFLDVMDETIKDCDMSSFTLYMANVFSNAERAFNKGDITQLEMRSLKESATVKVTGFLKNCECRKK
jgi:hypothetical protein